MTTTCSACDGCGKTDNSEDPAERAPWTFWKELPAGANIAVVMGIVKPMTCARCGGSGKLPDVTGMGESDNAFPQPGERWEFWNGGSSKPVQQVIGDDGAFPKTMYRKRIDKI